MEEVAFPSCVGAFADAVGKADQPRTFEINLCMDTAASSVVGSNTPARLCQPSRHTVVAIGVKTDHWRLVSEEFPGIVNCCLDVREAFQRGWNDDTKGTGSDCLLYTSPSPRDS